MQAKGVTADQLHCDWTKITTNKKGYNILILELKMQLLNDEFIK